MITHLKVNCTIHLSFRPCGNLYYQPVLILERKLRNIYLLLLISNRKVYAIKIRINELFNGTSLCEEQVLEIRNKELYTQSKLN